MSKTNKIIYWVSTVWLASAMVASGVQQLLHMDSFVNIITPLGYPMYLLTLLGIWKILGVIAILTPGFKLVKEWAYAGFFFAMTGAIFSHIASHSTWVELIPASTLTLMTVLSWYFRPENRKITSV